MTEGRRYPIPVAFMIGSLSRAGTARHLLQLVRAVDRDRFRLLVVCLDSEGELAGEVRAAGAEVVVVDFCGPRDPRFLLRFARLAATLRRLRPAVLHTYLFPANFYGLLAGRLARVPVIITSRRSMSEIEPRAQIRAYRWTSRLADRIVSVSRASAQSWALEERLPMSRFVVIENGIDGAAYDRPRDPALKQSLFGLPPNARLVGYVSNFRPVKRHEDFVAMAIRLAARRPDARFLCVGEGAGRGDIERLVASAGLSDRFLFAGERDDIPEVLRALDLFVYPSASEGMSNALMEAMTAGCPIVAARCAGNELVLGSGTARLVPAGDTEAMAGEAAGLLEDPAGALALGASARRRALSTFGVSGMARAFESLYLDCLAERGCVPAGTLRPGAPRETPTLLNGGR